MAVRLSELLERIRPAGTPGAAGDAVTADERAREGELAAVVAELALFDAEADRTTEAAHEWASEIIADAERRARAIRDQQADRVAVAGAAGAAAETAENADECRRITAAAATEIERRRERAVAERDRVAARVVDVIWSSIAEVAS